MPLMKLACTALVRVPFTRAKIIQHLMKKFHQDLVFCRAPEDNTLTAGVHGAFFGGKQGEGLTMVVENLLKKTDDCELAAIDALAAAAHSLVISLGIFCGKLQIEEAIELIRLEEDLQADKWGLVEVGMMLTLLT
ncbi:cystinosin-like protein [Hibiscus syriacus]|uniref:Cystinosin-like protein n=1 Tax=Hibiscus syriacus TaxID=106335 RepID=A0A6A2YPK9_HIBSY|nr:cystinosin-like protein [Hibiscus syriacus]